MPENTNYFCCRRLQRARACRKALAVPLRRALGCCSRSLVVLKVTATLGSACRRRIARSGPSPWCAQRKRRCTRARVQNACGRLACPQCPASSCAGKRTGTAATAVNLRRLSTARRRRAAGQEGTEGFRPWCAAHAGPWAPADLCCRAASRPESGKTMPAGPDARASTGMPAVAAGPKQ